MFIDALLFHGSACGGRFEVQVGQESLCISKYPSRGEELYRRVVPHSFWLSFISYEMNYSGFFKELIIISYTVLFFRDLSGHRKHLSVTSAANTDLLFSLFNSVEEEEEQRRIHIVRRGR